MENSTLMKDVQFLSVNIVYDGNVTQTGAGKIDIGGIHLSLDGREYSQDVTDTFWKYDEETCLTTIECLLMEDEDDIREIFTTNFELTQYDLHRKLDTATLFLAGEFDEEPEHITLFVRFMNEDGTGMTKAINLDIES